MTKPNLFIVGAPKAGTTSLFRYLESHTDIFLCDPKEPHFLNTDTNDSGNLDQLDDYLALFEQGSGKKYVGEGSTHYLMSEDAPKHIAEFFPDSKVIILLRRPVDLIYSAYFQNVYNGIEALSPFEKAMEAEQDRINGTIEDDVSKAEKFHLQYSRFVNYTKYIKAFWEKVGKENVHIGLFDDFKKSPEKVYESTLEFLGLPNSDDVNFRIHNKSKKNKSKTVQRFLKNPPKVVSKVARTILPANMRSSIYQKAQKANQTANEKLPLSKETERILVEKYATEVEQLSALIGVDLSHWNTLTSS